MSSTQPRFKVTLDHEGFLSCLKDHVLSASAMFHSHSKLVNRSLCQYQFSNVLFSKTTMQIFSARLLWFYLDTKTDLQPGEVLT